MVNPGDVPGHVVGQVVGKQHDLTQQDVRQVGLLVASFDVNFVFYYVTDHLLLLLPDLLFGPAVFALLLGAVEEALLLGDLGGLDPVLGYRHQVVEGLIVATVPAVVLEERKAEKRVGLGFTCLPISRKQDPLLLSLSRVLSTLAFICSLWFGF